MNITPQLANMHASRAVVNVYLSGTNGRLYWPYRLQPADRKDSTPSVRENAQTYILDSGASDDGIPASQLIEMAHRRQPDYVIPNDTVNTESVAMRTAVEETATKVADFLDRIDERRFPATVLIPLQPPHTFHYAYLCKHYPEQARRSHFALGGMKQASPAAQLEAVTAFRDAVGPEPYVHGFGMGGSRQLLLALRDRPSLLDSVDITTPQIHSRTGRTAGHARVPRYIGIAGGQGQASTTAHLMTAELLEITRLLDPRLDTDDIAVDWEQLAADSDAIPGDSTRPGATPAPESGRVVAAADAHTHSQSPTPAHTKPLTAFSTDTGTDADTDAGAGENTGPDGDANAGADADMDTGVDMGVDTDTDTDQTHDDTDTQ